MNPKLKHETAYLAGTKATYAYLKNNKNQGLLEYEKCES